MQYSDDYKLPKDFAVCHPTDAKMINKYKHGSFIDPIGFILTLSELPSMDTHNHDLFYKKMRVKLNILIDQGGNPIGKKWSYDADNRKKYEKDFEDTNILMQIATNKYVNGAMPIAEISKIKAASRELPWPTNRKLAMKHLKCFVRDRITQFGPYQDAIRKYVVVGYHSCLSPPLNIGLITPFDVIKEINKYQIPLHSLEGFVRQLIGWREFIRMKYVLHGQNGWDYLHNMKTPINQSWYNATTGYEALDWSIQRVLKYSYASHIERLMLLANYTTLLQIKYIDAKKWFITMFCDGYDWCMLNVEMGVNGLAKENRFMTRAYLTNGTYLVKMGLEISKEELSEMKRLYEQFIKNNEALAKKDYRLAAAVKRINRS